MFITAYAIGTKKGRTPRYLNKWNVPINRRNLFVNVGTVFVLAWQPLGGARLLLPAAHVAASGFQPDGLRLLAYQVVRYEL